MTRSRRYNLLCPIARALRMALAAHPSRPTLNARLQVDNDSFVITSTPDAVDVTYGDTTTEVDITAVTDYHALLRAPPETPARR